MITIEQAFFQYYPQFYDKWVKALLEVSKNKNYSNIYSRLHDFPTPDCMHLAMTRMEYMIRRMGNIKDVKSALLEHMGELTEEERKFIMDDVLYTECFQSWRRIFELMFFLK